MQELKTRITALLEDELAAIYTEKGIDTGDITPTQALAFDAAADQVARIFTELIQQNGGANHE